MIDKHFWQQKWLPFDFGCVFIDFYQVFLIYHTANMSADDKVAGECNESVATLPVHSELMCFIQQKCSVMTVDDLVQICSDFFTLKEVTAALTLIGQYLSDNRMSMHKDKATKMLTDIVKVFQDPVPRFYAMDLSRLPPVNVDCHVDLSAILQERLHYVTKCRQFHSGVMRLIS